MYFESAMKGIINIFN